ncbi:MAG: putative DNA binding domain-containing protein [Chloroflexota bacterium]|nr:putative DNA binding domain-containing protein [Chloroflexota bacterium]
MLEDATPPQPATQTATPSPHRRRPSAVPPEPPARSWLRVDLHIHTPASTDYQQSTVSPLDILRRADEQELDVIAFTDHNSVRGYAELWREIEDLELLEFLQRLEPVEVERLAEFRRLLSKILLLPGFELTATFGFHILAIFPERTSVRLMEHLLLLLGVPEQRFGSGEVGATTDVLRAYEILAGHGALVIGAHVNSAHGIAMQGIRFGGQTKIAYTQDANLHALEVTDLAVGAQRRSTARFFNGTKSEYPRRMHAIQGSDAHRLERDPDRETNLGVGDRPTAMYLPEASFAAIKALLQSTEFDFTKPITPRPADPIIAARGLGNTASQVFHESLTTKRTGMGHVLRDIVGLANSDGGILYVGLSASEKRPIAGVEADAAMRLSAEAAAQVTPAIPLTVDPTESDGKLVLVVTVPRGPERPHALTPGTIYIRRENESEIASRDEIVAMVREAAGAAVPVSTPPAAVGTASAVRSNGRGATEPKPRRNAAKSRAAALPSPDEPAAAPAPALDTVLTQYEEAAPVDPVAPTSGIEIPASFAHEGETYYTVHDLRHHKLIHNVTRATDRRLWRSAIAHREEHALDEAAIAWQGDYGLWRSYRPRGGERRYNLLYRGDGDIRVFYGVSESGLDERWREVLTH